MKPRIYATTIALALVAGGLVGGSTATAQAPETPDATVEPTSSSGPLRQGLLPTVPPGTLRVLPAPLACLLSTGSALFCVGVT